MDTRIPALKWVASDGTGGVWLATPQTLSRLDPQGQTVVALDPWPGPGPLVTVAGNPFDGSVWVGSATGVSHVSASGQVLGTQTFWSPIKVRRLALSADRLAPTISILSPVAGVVLNTATPTVEVAYDDVGTGVDPATLLVTARLATPTPPPPFACTTTGLGASCAPAAALPDGALTVTARVRDRAGNVSAPAAVGFRIDTLPPIVTLTAPANGAVTSQAVQQVTGQVNEAATLTVRLNGQAVETLPPVVGTFTASPVTLTEGANALDVVALDAAGNQSQLGVSLTLDTVPPAAVLAADLTVAFASGQATITGRPGGVEAAARVTITNQRTGEVVTVVAAADGSFTAVLAAQPGDALVLTVADGAGNTSGTTTTSVPVQVAITEPAQGATVAAGQLVVKGTVQAGSPDVGVVVNGVPAAVHGTGFVALVEVTPGTSALTATATGTSGLSGSHSVAITVIASATAPLVLDVRPGAGPGPLSVEFVIGDAPRLAAVELDLESDGTVDFVGSVSSLEERLFTYTRPGLYVAIARVTDGAGTISRPQAIVQVYDVQALDALLQAKWGAMKDALRAGDIAGALTHVALGSRDRYDTLFRIVAPRLPGIDGILPGLTLTTVDEGEAYYDTQRTDAGVLKSFEVRFVLDGDGIWRIASF